MQIELPRWYDLHAHFRQGEIMRALIADHLRMGCAGILAMPNTRPPVSKVASGDPGQGWSIQEYLDMLRAAGADAFSAVIVPLYLTAEATPALIEAGARSGLLKACKYYPPHGTTGAEHGSPLDVYAKNGVLQAMEECGVVLCVHGEEHGLPAAEYFARGTNAEEQFYRERLPRVLEDYPRLRVVAEHVTSAVAVRLVQQADTVAATVTPQHLLYTVGDLLRGLKYHLYCLPLLKFAEDRAALRAAVTDPANTKFFAGTDSAPHTEKATACGCAAGCYTGGIAPQLYAQAFEESGADLAAPRGQQAFCRFLCENGPAFYGLSVPQQTFMLRRMPQTVEKLVTPAGDVVPLPLGLAADAGAQAVTIPWSVVV